MATSIRDCICDVIYVLEHQLGTDESTNEGYSLLSIARSNYLLCNVLSTAAATFCHTIITCKGRQE